MVVRPRVGKGNVGGQMAKAAAKGEMGRQNSKEMGRIVWRRKGRQSSE